MTELRAILFDTFGTVVDWRGSLIAELTAFGAERGVAADWTALVDAWRGAYKPSMNEVRNGTRPWTKLDDLHRASLDRLVAEHGITGLTEADHAHLTMAWHRLRAWPDAAPGMLQLHRRYITGPLSNGNVSLLIDLARFNGLPWNMIFGAELFHHYKPDAEVYLGACELLSLPPSQVMLCAAHNDDLAAARALGLRTAFIARRTEYGPHQTKDVEATADWDYVASGVDQLAEQLAA